MFCKDRSIHALNTVGPNLSRWKTGLAMLWCALALLLSVENLSISIFIYLYLYLYLYLYICTYLCVHLSISIYIYLFVHLLALPGAAIFPMTFAGLVLTLHSLHPSSAETVLSAPWTQQDLPGNNLTGQSTGSTWYICPRSAALTFSTATQATKTVDNLCDVGHRQPYHPETMWRWDLKKTECI